ncbi:MAG: L7Ae/L30e/S12e/Gadd45 family ribosomal protein [Flavonifractor plautii]
MDNVLHLLGIARKAGRVEVGEEPVGASARARQARLILVASDAADNSARRAAHFAQAGKAPWSPGALHQGGAGRHSGPRILRHAGPHRVGLAAALLARLAAGETETVRRGVGGVGVRRRTRPSSARRNKLPPREEAAEGGRPSRGSRPAPPGKESPGRSRPGSGRCARGRLTVRKKTP